jgi:hypothetical protein
MSHEGVDESIRDETKQRAIEDGEGTLERTEGTAATANGGCSIALFTLPFRPFIPTQSTSTSATTRTILFYAVSSIVLALCCLPVLNAEENATQPLPL